MHHSSSPRLSTDEIQAASEVSILSCTKTKTSDWQRCWASLRRLGRRSSRRFGSISRRTSCRIQSSATTSTTTSTWNKSSVVAVCASWRFVTSFHQRNSNFQIPQRLHQLLQQPDPLILTHTIEQNENGEKNTACYDIDVEASSSFSFQSRFFRWKIR